MIAKPEAARLILETIAAVKAKKDMISRAAAHTTNSPPVDDTLGRSWRWCVACPTQHSVEDPGMCPAWAAKRRVQIRRRLRERGYVRALDVIGAGITPETFSKCPNVAVEYRRTQILSDARRSTREVWIPKKIAPLIAIFFESPGLDMSFRDFLAAITSEIGTCP